MKIPTEWPESIADAYDPVRVLGTGGFASVVLARPKTSSNKNYKVAIKVVGCTTDPSPKERSAAARYARREIELLEQISHAGIVRLEDSWEQQEASQTLKLAAGVLVLEYLKGPTVESLLKHGGALSTTFGRVVIAQVMDALAYLHYRAVLHRDIKPDNIIVTGAMSSDASIWDNEVNLEDIEDHRMSCPPQQKSPDEWKRLCHKYKATIIDFGFARALTPGDVDDGRDDAKYPQTSSSSKPHKKAGYNDIVKLDPSVLKAQKRKSKHNELTSSPRRKLFGSLRSDSFNQLDDSTHSYGSVLSTTSTKSVSHTLKRVMSTLGHRNYAAPEIVQKVRKWNPQDQKREKTNAQKTTKTISEYVADYGLLVDSYSMGHTIRYMMTGVEPGVSVEDTIKKQQRGIKAQKVLSKLGLTKKKKSDTTQPAPRKPRYRSLGDLPGQVFLLVEDLTQPLAAYRLSIRKARRTVPWISDVLSFQTNSVPAEIADEGTRTRSLDVCSEEQCHALDATRYLPLAVACSSHPVIDVSHTEDETQNMTAEFSLQTLSDEKDHHHPWSPLDHPFDTSGTVGLEEDMIVF